jgi:hypothetical protein
MKNERTPTNIIFKLNEDEDVKSDSNYVCINKDSNLKEFDPSLLSFAEIKQKLVQNNQHDMQRSKTFTKAEKICIVTNMMKKGKRVEEIAVYLNCSCKTVYRVCEHDICNGNSLMYKQLLKNRRFKALR